MATTEENAVTIRKLAEKVAGRVTQDAVYADAVKSLLVNVKAELRAEVIEGVVQALLTYRPILYAERDEQWVRGVASIWASENANTELPQNPDAMHEALRRWQNEREMRLRRELYNKGSQEGFAMGLRRGAKLGFGGATIGENLENILTKCEDLKISD